MPNVTFKHTYRWIDTRAAGSDSLASGVSPAALCCASAWLGTSAVNIFPTFAAVRIRMVRLFGLAAQGFGLTANSNIGVEFTRMVNGSSIAGLGSREITVPVMSSTELSRLSVKPPKDWLAGNWGGSADTNFFMYVRTLPGTTVELDLECSITDGNDASSFACSAGVLNSMGFAYLDLGTAAGLRVLRPIGALVSFN